MARKKRDYKHIPVMIGCKTEDNTAQDAVIAYLRDENFKGLQSGVDVLICGLDRDGSVQKGDKEFPLEKVTWIKTNLHFCNKEAMKGFMDVLAEMYAKWEETDNSTKNTPLAETVINNIAKEEDHMLLRRFVGSVGYDYLEHDKKNTAQIHPDFSEDTKLLWKEIESRLKGTTVLDFDREGALQELKDKAEEQKKLCEPADYTSSYHYGLKTGYYNSVGVIEKHTKKK